MGDLFDHYWWLLFPIMGFAFGGFGMWLNYKRSRDALDLIKTYAAQGKEPPEALIRAVAGHDNDDWDWGGRASRRAARQAWRWGPYGEIRRLVLFAGMALGFGFAAWWSGDPSVRLAFSVVTFVMGAMALSSLVMVVVGFKSRPPQ